MLASRMREADGRESMSGSVIHSSPDRSIEQRRSWHTDSPSTAPDHRHQAQRTPGLPQRPWPHIWGHVGLLSRHQIEIINGLDAGTVDLKDNSWTPLYSDCVSTACRMELLLEELPLSPLFQGLKGRGKGILFLSVICHICS
ncbi:hypothetical protein FQA47_002115 [Oryzias melastigma]|uniref:Uncharacterized protein n=1 Tax=Oryzias melastigma TaxID=30732 RepID=A0A834FFH8_ORYME|nr:hypothetical protein FQA47_002115 [Oryzias melastigma]